jgi:hypothetical protein
MADAPSPPTRKMSTMPTDRWRKLDSTTGTASRNICLRMFFCIKGVYFQDSVREETFALA